MSELIEALRNTPSVIAVTVGIGEAYEHLAVLSSATCARNTGLPVYTMGEESMLRHRVKIPQLLKFYLFDEFRNAETILFFDADMLFLSPVDLSNLFDLPEFVCVRDHWEKSEIIGEARMVRAKPKEYFNSGLFIVNRRHHAEFLRHAGKIASSWLPSLWAEQSAFNAARTELRIPLHFLSQEFNFLNFEGRTQKDEVKIGNVSGLANRPNSIISRYYQFWARRSLLSSGAHQSLIDGILGAYLYTRIGYDNRVLALLPDGEVGQGKAACEAAWDVTEEISGIVLWLISDAGQPICSMMLSPAGRWRGRWMRHEQMAVTMQKLR